MKLVASSDTVMCSWRGSALTVGPTGNAPRQFRIKGVKWHHKTCWCWERVNASAAISRTGLLPFKGWSLWESVIVGVRHWEREWVTYGAWGDRGDEKNIVYAKNGEIKTVCYSVREIYMYRNIVLQCDKYQWERTVEIIEKEETWQVNNSFFFLANNRDNKTHSTGE